MAVTLSWKRVGPGSGPANVLNGRYRVERALDTPVWLVRDLTTDQVIPCPGSPAPAYFRTMGLASRGAEDHVLREGSE